MLPAPPAEPGAPDLGLFKGATITVPSWGAGVASCPTGRVTLIGVQHVPREGRPISLMSYVPSDVDDDGVGDYVAYILCGEGPESPGWQVVAFRRSGNELVPIGRVIGSQDGLAMMSGLKAESGGRIAVNVSNQYTDSGEQYVPHQWRTFGWQGGRFRQVAGPTSFPANPPAARLSVDPADLVFRWAQGGRYVGEMSVRVGNAGDAAVANAVLTFFLPAEVKPAGDAWSGCTMRRFESSPTTVRIDCALGGLGPHTFPSLEFQLVADEKPRVLGSIETGADGPDNHYLLIDQLPPITFNDPRTFEADIRIVLPDA